MNNGTSQSHTRAAEARSRIDSWSAGVPVLTGEFAADSARTTSFLARGSSLLSSLPARPERGPREGELAGAIHGGLRQARRAFLAAYADTVYDELTEARRRPMRLEDLVNLAAERYPGLVPGRAEMDAEAQRMQEDKEGIEIDQGIFINAVLRCRHAGEHLITSMLRPTADALDRLPAFQRSGFADLGRVTVERSGGAGHVTVRNGRFLNAEDEPTVADLETAVDLVLLDDSIDVGVLRGGPVDHPRYQGRRAFSSGVNLTHLYEGRISLVGFMLRRELGLMHKILRGHVHGQAAGDGDLSTREKPWIGVVDSFAIGGGAQIALLLDHVIAEKGSYFSLPALIEGIIPGSANLRLCRFVGARAARRMVFWGTPVYADEPDGLLFCDRVAGADKIGAELDAGTEHLANPAVVGNRRILLNSEESADQFRYFIASYAAEQANLLHSPALASNLKRTWVERGAARSA